ncbi:MAG: spore coat protein [Clostridia bacterium]|nr:spore coat protein [Clostridia bacterium]
MNAFLTQKERQLLETHKRQEELCIQKYQTYAQEAQCQQLKQLFSNYAQKEQQHLSTINQILNGQIPNVSQQGSQGSQQQTTTPIIQGNQSNPSANMSVGTTNQRDMYLCQDALETEKHISSSYDTTIFEFSNSQIRQVLNHIQKEEQQHGEGISNYLQSKGMNNLS